MLGVGQKFPQFNLKSVVSNNITNAFQMVDNTTNAGKWLAVFFWPKDFTFVCPTEISEFGQMTKTFADRNTAVLGVSTDSEFVHLAWRTSHPALKDLPFPMVSDIKRELCEELGVLDPKEGVAQRATYLVDPQGTIRFVMVTDLSVGRNVHEVLRVLDALQTEGLTPCNWQKGQETITIAA
jgi:alkyl hydroperoxide reductase subunit AhpC